MVLTGIAKPDLKMGFLVVRKEATTRIHISEIHTLLIDSTMLVLVNVCGYLNENAYTSLCRELSARELSILFVETRAKKWQPFERQLIVDRDKCGILIG